MTPPTSGGRKCGINGRQTGRIMIYLSKGKIWGYFLKAAADMSRIL